MKRILVVGAKGMLGRSVVRHLRKQKLHVMEWDVADGDMSDEATAQWAFRNLRPESVVNAAGYTDVEGCEDEANAETARLANVVLPTLLARNCARAGAHLVHISTDYVFNGRASAPYTEDDEPDPLSAYARGKREAEIAVLDENPGALVLRTAWLYGRNGRNFVDTIRRRMRDVDRLEVVNDQRGCPTFADDLAQAILFAARSGVTGILHAAGGGDATWFELAREIAEIVGWTGEVVPCASDRWPTKVARPAYSVLDCSRLENATGFHFRGWSEAVASYLIET